MTCRLLIRYLTPAGLTLCALLLSGCGQKGPLVLNEPQDTTTQTTAQPSPPPANAQPTNTQP